MPIDEIAFQKAIELDDAGKPKSSDGRIARQRKFIEHYEASRPMREYRPLTDEEIGEVIDLLLEGAEGEEDLTDCMTFGLSKVLDKFELHRRGTDV